METRDEKSVAKKDHTSTVLRMAGNIAGTVLALRVVHWQGNGGDPFVLTSSDRDEIARLSVDIAQRILKHGTLEGR